MECYYYSLGLKLWGTSEDVSNAFITQVQFFEDDLKCMSGIIKIREGHYRVDQEQLRQFIFALSKFASKTNTPARWLKEGVAILCIALLDTPATRSKELSDLYSLEIIDWADYCFIISRSSLQSSANG